MSSTRGPSQDRPRPSPMPYPRPWPFPAKPSGIAPIYALIRDTIRHHYYTAALRHLQRQNPCHRDIPEVVRTLSTIPRSK
jgi:hypothetical protein